MKNLNEIASAVEGWLKPKPAKPKKSYDEEDENKASKVAKAIRMNTGGGNK